jgi:tetratricopeptide (TPR) repeat protein
MNLLIELGNTYSKLGDFQKSIRCFRKSAFLAQQNNDEGILGIAYKNWASVALHLKDDQTA